MLSYNMSYLVRNRLQLRDLNEGLQMAAIAADDTGEVSEILVPEMLERLSRSTWHSWHALGPPPAMVMVGHLIRWIFGTREATVRFDMIRLIEKDS